MLASGGPQVGGFEAYLLAEEDGEGAAAEEVYRPVGGVLPGGGWGELGGVLSRGG